MSNIAGYRTLTADEVALINEGKALAAQAGAYLAKLQVQSDLDQRAIALGRTNLQQGFMWLTRGIARPTDPL